jgi:hypothetical protein
MRPRSVNDLSSRLRAGDVGKAVVNEGSSEEPREGPSIQHETRSRRERYVSPWDLRD